MKIESRGTVEEHGFSRAFTLSSSVPGALAPAKIIAAFSVSPYLRGKDNFRTEMNLC
jgi:hypothetical protein